MVFFQCRLNSIPTSPYNSLPSQTYQNMSGTNVTHELTMHQTNMMPNEATRQYRLEDQKNSESNHEEKKVEIQGNNHETVSHDSKPTDNNPQANQNIAKENNYKASISEFTLIDKNTSDDQQTANKEYSEDNNVSSLSKKEKSSKKKHDDKNIHSSNTKPMESKQSNANSQVLRKYVLSQK